MRLAASRTPSISPRRLLRRHCHAPINGLTAARTSIHVELVRKARGAEMPASFWTDPLIYQGGSDDLLGPADDVPFLSEEFGIDLEAEVAVITDDVPMNVSTETARGTSSS